MGIILAYALAVISVIIGAAIIAAIYYTRRKYRTNKKQKARQAGGYQ